MQESQIQEIDTTINYALSLQNVSSASPTTSSRFPAHSSSSLSASPLCLTCRCSQTVFQKLTKTKQNSPLPVVVKKRRKRKRRDYRGITCEANSQQHSTHQRGCIELQLFIQSQQGIKNEYKAGAFVIPVLVAEIVIKLQREMDAKIGLDTNYQRERHLCKCPRSLNFSHSEPSPSVCWGAEGSKRRKS